MFLVLPAPAWTAGNARSDVDPRIFQDYERPRYQQAWSFDTLKAKLQFESNDFNPPLELDYDLWLTLNRQAEKLYERFWNCRGQKESPPERYRRAGFVCASDISLESDYKEFRGNVVSFLRTSEVAWREILGISLRHAEFQWGPLHPLFGQIIPEIIATALAPFSKDFDRCGDLFNDLAKWEQCWTSLGLKVQKRLGKDSNVIWSAIVLLNTSDFGVSCDWLGFWPKIAGSATQDLLDGLQIAHDRLGYKETIQGWDAFLAQARLRKECGIDWGWAFTGKVFPHAEGIRLLEELGRRYDSGLFGL